MFNVEQLEDIEEKTRALVAAERKTALAKEALEAAKARHNEAWEAANKLREDAYASYERLKQRVEAEPR